MLVWSAAKSRYTLTLHRALAQPARQENGPVG